MRFEVLKIVVIKTTNFASKLEKLFLSQTPDITVFSFSILCFC
jgi:hypothetical protein